MMIAIKPYVDNSCTCHVYKYKLKYAYSLLTQYRYLFECVWWVIIKSMSLNLRCLYWRTVSKKAIAPYKLHHQQCIIHIYDKISCNRTVTIQDKPASIPGNSP